MSTASIIIKSKLNEGESEELMLIEFQGKIENSAESSMDGLELGHLQYENGKPVCYIGKQKLTGKEVKLTKPLAILKQPRLTATEFYEKGQGEMTIEVSGLIRKKIIFDTRPATIMH